MTRTETLYNAIKEAIEDLSTSDLVYLHNEYCDAVNYYDDRIYYMDEFNDLEYGRKPLEIALLVQGEDFNVNDDYYRYTIYGVESFDYPEEYIDIEEIAEYIVDNDDALNYAGLRYVLDEYYYDEENDEEDEIK